MILDGASVIVTGGAAGIGLGIAEALIGRGARPILVDCDAPALAAARERLQCPGYVADVTVPEQVDDVVAAICETDGVPQGLVNNAGLISSMPLLNLFNRSEPRHPVELWERVIAANLTSVFLMTRAVADRMARKRIRGAVVSISSISARGNAGQTAYAAAKAGVEAMTLVWARELGALGLRFVAVAPGFIDTPSTHAALAVEKLDEVKHRTPLHRLGTAAEVGKAVVYAFENDMVTGTVLQVDGGLTL